MTLDPDRRSTLLAAQLRAVVQGRWSGLEGAATAPFPGGAALGHEPSGRLWILLDEGGTHRLGGCLALAARRGAHDLHLIVDDAEIAAVLARRAAPFASPATVWVLRGRELEPATPAPAALDLTPPPVAELYRPVLVAAGLEPVVEGGHLLGEVLGLEVGRVVVDGDDAHVEAGVGRFDREVAAMMFAELSETDALANAAAVVAEVRRPHAPPHPLNQLVRERWLRSVLIAHPHLVGAASLEPVGSAMPRTNLKDPGVASAVGVDLSGSPVVVTCSTGVDLELVPSAADDRLAHAPGAELVLAVPARDAMAVTTELASHLSAPARVVAVPDGWTELLEPLGGPGDLGGEG